MTVHEQFTEFATTHKLDANDQIAILLGYIQDNAVYNLAGFLEVLHEELTKPTTPAPYVPTTPATQVAEMSNFIDRSLARAILLPLDFLPGAGPAYEREGHDTVRLLIPPAEWQSALDILSGKVVPRAGTGMILYGVYYTFSDGNVGVVALTQGSREQLPYLDAVLILPDGVYPTSPNISLPPTRSLEEDFVFQYPDGTFKVIRLAQH